MKTVEELCQLLKDKGCTAVPCKNGPDATAIVCDKNQYSKVLNLLGLPLDNRIVFS